MAENCKTYCPKFALCEAMKERGLTDLMLAHSRDDKTVEFQDEVTGALISPAEFWGTADLTDEQIERLEEAGTALRDSGTETGRLLLEGCQDGPRRISDEVVLCQSTNASVVFWTKEDLA